MDRWRALVIAVMNYQIPYGAGKFLTSLGPVSFSIMALLIHLFSLNHLFPKALGFMCSLYRDFYLAQPGSRSAVQRLRIPLAVQLSFRNLVKFSRCIFHPSPTYDHRSCCVNQKHLPYANNSAHICAKRLLSKYPNAMVGLYLRFKSY